MNKNRPNCGYLAQHEIKKRKAELNKKKVLITSKDGINLKKLDNFIQTILNGKKYDLMTPLNVFYGAFEVAEVAIQEFTTLAYDAGFDKVEVVV